MKSEYLLFNLLVILGPLFSSLFVKELIKPKIFPAIMSIAFVAMIFIAGDILVTGYFWDFNPRYILGIKIFNLPLEEAIFFLTVPSACLFLWLNLEKRYAGGKTGTSLIEVSAFVFFTASLLFFSQAKFYTAATCLSFSFLIVTDLFFTKTKLLKNKAYLAFLVLVLFLTLLFNYYLTARPIVIYNLLIKTNLYVFTIPVEDFIYSFNLILANTILYKYLAEMKGGFTKKVVHYFKREGGEEK